MNSSNKTFWPLVAAVGLGVSFVGYCLYFDRKRRSAPDFLQKLRAKRLRQKKEQRTDELDSKVDINNPEEMRNCFLEHIQNGDACLSRGDLDNGIEHLAKAVSFCNHPQDLLALFQQTLPRELFEAIVMRVPRMAQATHNLSSSVVGSSSIVLPELDLE